MRKTIFFAFALFVEVLILYGSSVQGEQTKAPAIAIEPRVLEVKDELQGQSIMRSFAILNKGNGPLVIKDVKPG